MYKFTVLAVALLIAFMGPSAHAEDMASLLLTDAQIAQIRSNCTDVQSTIQRLHANDALVRVNLARRYETIAIKLMAPMNSRIALNRLDNVALTQTTVNFNSALDEFRLNYQQYGETISKAIEMKCVDQPVAFYDTIAVARTQRATVHTSVAKLNDLVKQYGDQFSTFRAQLASNEKGSK